MVITPIITTVQSKSRMIITAYVYAIACSYPWLIFLFSLRTTTTITGSRITTTRPCPHSHTQCPKRVTLTVGMRTLTRLSGVVKCTGRTVLPNPSLLFFLCRIYPVYCCHCTFLLPHLRIIHILLILIFWTGQLYSGILVDMCMHV